MRAETVLTGEAGRAALLAGAGFAATASGVPIRDEPPPVRPGGRADAAIASQAMARLLAAYLQKA